MTGRVRRVIGIAGLAEERAVSIAAYVVRRLLLTVVTLIAISMVSFVVIQLPPGGALPTGALGHASSGGDTIGRVLDDLRQVASTVQAWSAGYATWMSHMLRGDFGEPRSVPNTTTNQLIAERAPMTALLAFTSALLGYLVAVPLGVYCAVKRGSLADLAIVAIAYVGMAVPAFLLALALLWAVFLVTGRAETGLLSLEMRLGPWTWQKVLDLLEHLAIPLSVVGIGGTAATIRVMRSVLLDELHQPYVVAARARGISENRLLVKYSFRMACNPIVSGVGSVLPALVSGGVLVEIVLDLPTMGPLLLRALMNGDVYLGGTVVMIISTLTVIGVMISDVLLALLDPRIRFDR